MRIDKYLWAIRVYKTRGQAATACKAGRVTLNEDISKASKDIKIGDIISVRRAAIYFTLKIKDIPKSRVGAKLVPDYIVDLTPQEEYDKLEMIRLANKDVAAKRLGRPTKKDRRDLNKFLD